MTTAQVVFITGRSTGIGRATATTSRRPATPKARHTAGFPLSGRLVLRLGDPAWALVVGRLFAV